MVTPNQGAPLYAKPSPQVPIIHNRLTHIAAPQPNRVSPLAVAKHPSIELELVNGQPQVVRSRRTQQSRPSSGSPMTTGNASSSKNKRKKEPRNAKANKRRRYSDWRPDSEQREAEVAHGRGRFVRPREPKKAANLHRHAPTPEQRGRLEHASLLEQQEPYIKPEPVSPPPLSGVPELQPGGFHYRPQRRPAELDLVPSHQTLGGLYNHAQPSRPPPGFDYQPPIVSPMQIASPAYQPRPRDTQDLRRVATLHNAQRPPSPTRQLHSPATTYRAISVVHPAAEPQYYQDAQRPVQYRRVEKSLSPHAYEYMPQNTASNGQPTMMVSPVGPPPHTRRVVEDQYGRRFYAPEAEPLPQAPRPPQVVVNEFGDIYYPVEPKPAAPVSATRASMAPPPARSEGNGSYQRAPSRLQPVYLPADQQAYRETAGPSMGPPPPRRQVVEDLPVEYVDSNGYRVRASSTRPETSRYNGSLQPVSSSHPQQVRAHPMPPVEYEPSRAPASPMYTPSRSYSVRPDRPVTQALQDHHTQDYTPPEYVPRQATAAPFSNARPEVPRYYTEVPTGDPTHASVAPVQYVRHEVPPPPAAPPASMEAPPTTYIRHASIAPVQYARQDVRVPTSTLR